MYIRKDIAKKMLEESNQTKAELEMWIKEASDNFSAHHTEQSSLVKSLQRELEISRQKIQEENAQYLQCMAEKEKDTGKMIEIEGEIEELRVQLLHYSDLARSSDHTRMLLEKSWNEREALAQQVNESYLEFSKNSK